VKITIHAPLEVGQIGFLDSITARITRTLTRFSDRIYTVTVALADENGPRGGIDKQCRVSVVMPRFGQISASAKHENPWTAVAQATERVRRMVLTKLKRPTALQVRRRRNPTELIPSETSDSASSDQ